MKTRGELLVNYERSGPVARDTRVPLDFMRSWYVETEDHLVMWFRRSVHWSYVRFVLRYRRLRDNFHRTSHESQYCCFYLMFPLLGN